MQYRTDRQSGNRLSILGYGCMRLPGALGRIDMEKSFTLLQRAYEQGVNYFDTAYLYPGSEEALGAFLEKSGVREKVYIATKLPQSACKSREDFERYFAEQKKRLRTDYIDYYLLHNISSFAQWERLREAGIEDWIAGKKAGGGIRRIGFSYHGAQQEFMQLLDAYAWDFVQIQYNYINRNYQAGEAGLRRAAEKGLPVIIMEPLLGGKLASSLPKGAAEVLQRAQPGSTPASWGLRWLWNQPEVTVVLSGMNEPAQLEENLELAGNAQPGMFGAAEEETIQRVVDVFNAGYKVRCTGCNYCMPCPEGIHIPACFTAYNTSYAVGWMTGETQYMNVVGVIAERPRFASDCIGCGKCEKQCPQGIEIRKSLKAVKRRFEIPGLKTAIRVVRKVML